MSNNIPQLKDMGEHAKQLLGLIQECKPDANLELLAGKLKQWRIELDKLPTKTDFIIHDDRTVTHVQTGLMWKRDLEGIYTDKYNQPEAKAYTYDAAMYAFRGSNYFADYHNWRLPTIDELKELSPYIDEDIFNISGSWFVSDVWSSTTGSDPDYPNEAWHMSFRKNGQSWCMEKNYENIGVVLVRTIE